MGLLKIYPPVRAYFINAAVFVSLMLKSALTHPGDPTGNGRQGLPRNPRDPWLPKVPQGPEELLKGPHGL